jgi:single-strand DNA-binding protein
MPSFNRVLLMGHLTRDPQSKFLPSQTQVCDFGLAVNRKYKTAGGEEREDVLFIDCSAFGNVAKTIDTHFKKGKAIFVEGRLKLDQWEDKNGGGKRSKISAVVEGFRFVGGPANGNGSGSGGSSGDELPTDDIPL